MNCTVTKLLRLTIISMFLLLASCDEFIPCLWVSVVANRLFANGFWHSRLIRKSVLLTKTAPCYFYIKKNVNFDNSDMQYNVETYKLSTVALTIEVIHYITPFSLNTTPFWLKQLIENCDKLEIIAVFCVWNFL